MYTIYLDKVDSTNTYAKSRASELPPDEICCISAEEQTAGRGREQKTWVSPKGVNLYVTFCFQLPPHTLHLSSIGQVLALSCVSVLKQLGFCPQIKWPNDIQLEGKKLAGILCETSFHSSRVDLFLGLGININMRQEQLAQIEQGATSLLVETGRSWDKHLILQELQIQFAKDLKTFRQKGFTPFHQQFEKLLSSKGQIISCFDGKKKWTGICHSISPDGRLNLLLADHQIKTFSSGYISVPLQSHPKGPH